MKKNDEIKFEIKETIGVISEKTNGWRKEINLVSWNGAEPKYDIREWSPEHDKMSKGLTMTREEVQVLASLLSDDTIGGAE